MQSVGAAKAVSLAIGHNPGWVTTPSQDTSKLALVLPTSEGRQAESTPPGMQVTYGTINTASRLTNKCIYQNIIEHILNNIFVVTMATLNN